MSFPTLSNIHNQEQCLPTIPSQRPSINAETPLQANNQSVHAYWNSPATMPIITNAMAVQLAPFEFAVPVYAAADGAAVAL